MIQNGVVMLKKIKNTLLYGDSKTKQYLISIFISLAATVALGIFAVLHMSPLLFVLTVCAVGVDIMLVQSVTLTEASLKGKQEGTKEEKKKRIAKKPIRDKQKGEEKSEKKEQQKATAEEEQFDEQQLYRVFVKYKVRKEHYPVMVDICKSEKIYQCPGYVWVSGGYFYLLLLEKEARCLKRLVKQLTTLYVEQGVPAKPIIDYAFLQEKSLISKVFASYAPNYYRKGLEEGKVDSLKNLYILDKDLCFTANSVKNLMRILQLTVVLEDKKIESDRYSEYYKEIYKKKILWRDGIYSIEEYKEEVKEILTRLSRADISEETFERYTMHIIFDKLIPQEYMDYAYAQRKKKKGIFKRRKKR